MDVFVHADAIPSIGTLTQVKTKAQVQLDLGSSFNELRRIATSPDLLISANTMHKYVAGPAALKTMMHILSNELDRGAQVVYPEAMDARVRSLKYISLEYMDTITHYRAWH